MMTTPTVVTTLEVKPTTIPVLRAVAASLSDCLEDFCKSKSRAPKLHKKKFRPLSRNKIMSIPNTAHSNVFVYGTLKREMFNHKDVKSIQVFSFAFKLWISVSHSKRKRRRVFLEHGRERRSIHRKRRKISRVRHFRKHSVGFVQKKRD